MAATSDTTNPMDEGLQDLGVPVPVQTFLWQQIAPFIRPKLGKLHEASCMVSWNFLSCLLKIVWCRFLFIFLLITECDFCFLMLNSMITKFLNRVLHYNIFKHIGENKSAINWCLSTNDFSDICTLWSYCCTSRLSMCGFIVCDLSY